MPEAPPIERPLDRVDDGPGERAPAAVARRRRPNRRALVLASLLGVVVLVAAVGPSLVPYDLLHQDLLDTFARPSGEHWLGTDAYGRDVLTRLVHGTRVSLLAALLAVSIGLVLGVPAGLISGYTRGRFAAVCNLVSDVLLSIPPIILALAVAGFLGPGLVKAMSGIGVVIAPRFYRVASSSASAVRTEPFIEIARSLGCSTAYILRRHVLRNAAPPILVQVTFAFGLAIVAEASLSFIGLGVQLPDVSLGTMVKESFETVRTDSFQIYPPTVLVALVIYLCSTLGDVLRDKVSRLDSVDDQR